MARVTVEDCLEHVENRFKLVLLASKRARQLTLGTEPLVEWENDKPTVVALREIAKNLVNEEMMQASLAAPIEEDVEFDEDDLAAALHAEISRELSQTTTSSPVTEFPKPQAEPASMSSNSFFAGKFSIDSSQVGSRTDEQNKKKSQHSEPTTDSSSEGEQGF